MAGSFAGSLWHKDRWLLCTEGIYNKAWIYIFLPPAMMDQEVVVRLVASQDRA